jgi:hypothetical protein
MNGLSVEDSIVSREECYMKNLLRWTSSYVLSLPTLVIFFSAEFDEDDLICTWSRKNGLKVYISFLPIVSAKEKTTYRTIRQSQQRAKKKEVAAVASSSGIRMGI